ncbi:MAG: carbohydrate binding family 9 domain-containing protein, partial [Planctomycetes bacterium]|nr:carbohydrate binding family 9 domain-containing protein [Planctomycetota bacterium]
MIDGNVTDAEWKGAAVATDFVQYEPRRGEPSTVKTEALVMYDAGHLYVAFRAWDSEPLTAQLTQRDADLLSDDSVAVLLDSYGDRQSGYLFITNILGTQFDARVADDGRQVDTSWDAPWQSAARRTEFGWTAELAIPLTSIRYASGDNRTWGINLGRNRRRTLEFSTWAGPLDNRARVSQSGRLVGLDVPASAHRHQVVPFGLTRLQQGVSPDWQIGIDARYALTPQMAVYGTLNPDFATIEADQEEINLTRFEVSLKEKRQFFLEGQELFGQRIQTFYSRRISEMTGGGKLLGRTGPWTLVFLSAETPELAGTTNRANYTVGRVQRDVFGRSNVSVMAANRLVDGTSQGSVGIDTNLFFTKTFGMTAQVVKSYGPYRDGTLAYYVRPSYDSTTGHLHVRYTNLGYRFADNTNVIGFTKDDDRRELDGAAEKTLWFKTGAVERLQYLSNYNVYWGHTGTLRSWEIRESAETEFRNRVSAKVSYIGDFKRFEKDFHNSQIGFNLGYNTRAYQSVRIGYTFGRSFDSDFSLWTAAARYKVTPELSAEYELQRLVMTPDPSNKTTWIHVVRANQFFTKDLFLRLFFQTNSAIDRRNVQAVFVYRYRPPFGTIQVAYQRGTAAFG